MISIDMTSTGAGTVTPPALGLWTSRLAEDLVRMAPGGALLQGTGLPTVGTAIPTRLRGVFAAAGRTGDATGVPSTPSTPTTALQAAVVDGVPVEQISSTPGALPPEDPLS